MDMYGTGILYYAIYTDRPYRYGTWYHIISHHFEVGYTMHSEPLNCQESCTLCLPLNPTIRLIN